MVVVVVVVGINREELGLNLGDSMGDEIGDRLRSKRLWSVGVGGFHSLLLLRGDISHSKGFIIAGLQSYSGRGGDTG